MYKQMIVLAAAALALTVSLGAQSKTVTGKEVTVTAVIEGIEQGTRQLYVKKAGRHERRRLRARGDQALRQPQGRPEDHRQATTKTSSCGWRRPAPRRSIRRRSAVTPAAGLAGTAARQQTITATIVAIDPKLPSVSFTGPRGWNYTTRVEDKALLSKFKVGDKVDITWTEATLVSVEDAK